MLIEEKRVIDATLVKNKSQIDKVIATVIVLVMILGSGDSANVGLWLPARYGLLFFNFIFTAVLCLKKGKCNVFMLKIYIVLCLLVFSSMIVNLDMRGYTMWMLLAIAFFTEEVIDYEMFYEVFENIMLWISIFSLVGMIIWFVCPSIIFAFPKINGAVTDIRNLFVTVVPTTYEGFSFRNYGIFREPAMFCIYIGIALVRQLFLVKDISVIKSFIFIVAVATTRSATGYIALVFLLMAFLFFKKKGKKGWIFSFVIILGGMIVGEALGLFDYLLSRLDTQGASAYSVNSRLYSIVGGVMAGLTNPIFGRGATKSGNVFMECIELLTVPEGGVCWANMVTYLFASFGIIFLGFFLAGLYGMGMSFLNYKTILASIVIFIVLLLCGETMTYSTILYTFMMYGLRNLRDRKRLSMG